MGQSDPQDQELLQDSNNAAQGSGRRPLGKEQPFKSFETQSKSEFDSKGKKIFDGYAPGQSFRKKSGAELIGDVRQASQEAPEALEMQRIPKAAQEMAKGYFQRMREQADKSAPAPKSP